METNESVVLKRRDYADVAKLQDPTVLQQFLEEPLTFIAETITGALAEGARGTSAAGGRIVQAILKGQAFKQFAAEFKRLRETGRIPDVMGLQSHSRAVQFQPFRAGKMRFLIKMPPCIGPLFLLLCPILLNAEEVKFIDLTVVSQRTEIRYPPSLNCREGTACGGGCGTAIVDGAPDNQRALAVYLTKVFSTAVNPAEPFDAEFKVLNDGAVAIELPVSPDLSDLQPVDESLQFTYFYLTLTVTVQGDLQALATAELYGSNDHSGTMLTLRPGEWIRVKARVKPTTPKYVPKSDTASLSGGFRVGRNTVIPHPGCTSLLRQYLYSIPAITPPIDVRFLASAEARR